MHKAAIRFAKATGTVVIHWMASWSHWAQKPPDQYLEDALLDPCFYENWLYDADAALTGKVSAHLCLINAQSLRCHSLTLSDPEMQRQLEQ